MDRWTEATAFPAEEWLQSEDPHCINPVRHRGMSLREYFAAHATDGDVSALRGLVPTCTKIKVGPNGMKHVIYGAEPDNWRALARYMHADLMLALSPHAKGLGPVVAKREGDGVLNADDVRRIVADKLKDMTQVAVAESMGVSASYLNDYLHFRRELGPKILEALGLRVVVGYERAGHDAS